MNTIGELIYDSFCYPTSAGISVFMGTLEDLGIIDYWLRSYEPIEDET